MKTNFILKKATIVTCLIAFTITLNSYAQSCAVITGNTSIHAGDCDTLFVFKNPDITCDSCPWGLPAGLFWNHWSTGATTPSIIVCPTTTTTYTASICGGSQSASITVQVDDATGIHENNFSDQINIYPNPTNGIFTFQTTLKFTSLEIMNLLGEKIYSSQVNSGNSSIDLSSQPLGIYFLQLKTDQGTAVKRIMKD